MKKIEEIFAEVIKTELQTTSGWQKAKLEQFLESKQTLTDFIKPDKALVNPFSSAYVNNSDKRKQIDTEINYLLTLQIKAIEIYKSQLNPKTNQNDKKAWEKVNDWYFPMDCRSTMFPKGEDNTPMDLSEDTYEMNLNALIKK